MFTPEYRVNDRILQMLTEVAEARSVISRARILPAQEIKLRRQALVRMTHGSTAIEGNILNVREVEALAAKKKIDAPQRDIYEVQNYLNAMRFIAQAVKDKRKISDKLVLDIHGLVTANTLEKASSGRYRTGPVYVVRRHAGGRQEVLYTAPDAKIVARLMTHLIVWVRESAVREIHPVIVAGVVHQEIAAIHPFNDGNGRTARALATYVLYDRGYDFRRLFALEDFYNEDRPSYYAAIAIGKTYKARRTDFTPWLEYFISGFKHEIDRVKRDVTMLSSKKVGAKIVSQIYLDKEQMVIIDFLDSVGLVTAKDVADILRCPKRTAQLYLLRMKKLKMIKQVGRGPAAKYVLA